MDDLEELKDSCHIECGCEKIGLRYEDDATAK